MFPGVRGKDHRRNVHLPFRRRIRRIVRVAHAPTNSCQGTRHATCNTNRFGVVAHFNSIHVRTNRRSFPNSTTFHLRDPFRNVRPRRFPTSVNKGTPLTKDLTLNIGDSSSTLTTGDHHAFVGRLQPVSNHHVRKGLIHAHRGRFTRILCKASTTTCHRQRRTTYHHTTRRIHRNNATVKEDNGVRGGGFVHLLNVVHPNAFCEVPNVSRVGRVNPLSSPTIHCIRAQGSSFDRRNPVGPSPPPGRGPGVQLTTKYLLVGVFPF